MRICSFSLTFDTPWFLRLKYYFRLNRLTFTLPPLNPIPHSSCQCECPNYTCSADCSYASEVIILNIEHKSKKIKYQSLQDKPNVIIFLWLCTIRIRQYLSLFKFYRKSNNISRFNCLLKSGLQTLDLLTGYRLINYNMFYSPSKKLQEGTRINPFLSAA